MTNDREGSLKVLKGGTRADTEAAPLRSSPTNSDLQSDIKKGQQSWQKTKSQLTRKSILKATIDCFFDLGYARTTMEHISKCAGVSRGAMLHHFPSRADLIRETIKFLNQQRIETFAREEFVTQQGAEHTRIDEGIDTFWRLLNTPEFIVFHELKIAARTDTELAEVMTPSVREYEAAAYAAAKDVFPDLATSQSFDLANFITLYVLEGLALEHFTGNSKGGESAILAWLKAELHKRFADVSDVRRRED